MNSRTSHQQEGGKEMAREMQISTRTLIVLCGTAGAGKSTFAMQHFEPTQVVSSDICRALICDGDRTQNVDPDIFDLFYFLIQKRLKLGRLTVADSTALYDFARRRLLDLAHDADYHTCLLVFNVPRAVCLQRDQQRPRKVGDKEIFIQDALQHIHHEPWEQIHVLGETDAEVRFIWQTNNQESWRSSGQPS
jgi:predicted kinase